MQESTEFLGRACGQLCPTFWHKVTDNAYCLAIDWNIDNLVRQCVENMDIEWRLNMDCVNPECPYHINQMCGNFEGTDCDHGMSVKFTSGELGSRQPISLSIVTYACLIITAALLSFL